MANYRIDKHLITSIHANGCFWGEKGILVKDEFGEPYSYWSKDIDPSTFRGSLTLTKKNTDPHVRTLLPALTKQLKTHLNNGGVGFSAKFLYRVIPGQDDVLVDISNVRYDLSRRLVPL
jgi:hypothetical protein